MLNKKWLRKMWVFLFKFSYVSYNTGKCYFSLKCLADLFLKWNKFSRFFIIVILLYSTLIHKFLQGTTFNWLAGYVVLLGEIDV